MERRHLGGGPPASRRHSGRDATLGLAAHFGIGTAAKRVARPRRTLKIAVVARLHFVDGGAQSWRVLHRRAVQLDDHVAGRRSRTFGRRTSSSTRTPPPARRRSGCRACRRSDRSAAAPWRRAAPPDVVVGHRVELRGELLPLLVAQRPCSLTGVPGGVARDVARQLLDVVDRRAVHREHHVARLDPGARRRRRPARSPRRARPCCRRGRAPWRGRRVIGWKRAPSLPALDVPLLAELRQGRPSTRRSGSRSRSRSRRRGSRC